MPSASPHRRSRLVPGLVLGLLLAVALGPAAAAAETCDERRVGRGAPLGAAAVDDGFWVAWTDPRPQPTGLYVRHLDRDGRPTAPAVRVDDGSATVLAAAVAANDAGPLVAWTTETAVAGRFALRVAPLTADGTPGASVTLTENVVFGGVALAPYNRRRIAAVWVEGAPPGLGGTVRLQRLDPRGMPRGGARAVGTGTETAWAFSPAVAMARPGLLVTWETLETIAGPNPFGHLARGPFARLYGPAPLGPAALAADVLENLFRGPVVAGDDGELVVVWTEDRTARSRVVARGVDGRTGEVGPLRILANEPFAADAALAVDAHGRFLAAWLELDPATATSRIAGRWLDATANPTAHPFTLAPTGHQPTLAAQPDGRFLLLHARSDDLAGGRPLLVARCLDAP